MLFGDKLKSIRKEKNISQNAMADLLFMGQSNYCKFETNKKEPTLGLLLLISKQFDIPINELIVNSNINGIEIGRSSLAAKNNYSISKEFLDSFLSQMNETRFYMRDIVKRLKRLEREK